MNKTLRIMVLATGVMVFGSGLALAKPDKPANNAPAMCAPMSTFQNLSPEKQEMFKKMMMEHQDSMATLHDQIKVKSMELKALSNNPNTQPDALSKIAAEIGDLKGKVRAEKIAMRGKMETEVGFFPAMMGNNFHDGHGKRKGHNRDNGHNMGCPGIYR